MPSENYNEIFKKHLKLILKNFEKEIVPERAKQLELEFDEIIHNIDPNQSKEYNESVIIQNILKKLIILEPNNMYNDAIVDFCALNYLQKENIFPEYMIKDTKNVIDLKEKLNNTKVDIDTILEIMFNGTIYQVIDLKEPIVNNEYENLINSIASGFKENSSDFIGYAHKLVARTNEEEALEIIKETCRELERELTPDIIESITKIIDNYLDKKAGPKLS